MNAKRLQCDCAIVWCKLNYNIAKIVTAVGNVSKHQGVTKAKHFFARYCFKLLLLVKHLFLLILTEI